MTMSNKKIASHQRIFTASIKSSFNLSFVTFFFFHIYCSDAKDPENSHGNEETNQKPLWEFGLFNGFISVPKYRGSEENDFFAAPIPYLIYRGQRFQSDEEGVRGIFSNTEKFEIDLSISGSPPIEESSNAREGLPELDAIIEIGPAIKWHLNGRNEKSKLYLRATLRSASSARLENGIDFFFEGYHGVFSVVYKKDSIESNPKLSLGFNAAIDFIDSSYSAYFYDVPDKSVTTDRERFNSSGGYGGFMVATNIVRKFNENLSIGVIFRWENLEGAIFENSPVVKQKNNISIGFALIWKLRESKQLIKNSMK